MGFANRVLSNRVAHDENERESGKCPGYLLDEKINILTATFFSFNPVGITHQLCVHDSYPLSATIVSLSSSLDRLSSQTL